MLKGEVAHRYRHRKLALEGHSGETREAFLERAAQAARDRADEEKAKVKGKVDAQVAKLEEKRSRVEDRRATAHADARARTATEVVNAGEVLFGMFFGRRRSLTTVASKRQLTMKAQEKLGRLDDDLAELERRVYDLETEVGAELDAIDRRWEQVAAEVEEVEVRLDAGDLRLVDLAVLWVPVSRPLGR